MKKKEFMKNNTTTMVLASAGALGGLYYAFKKKKGFWGYAGFFVLGSIAGHLAGNIITSVIPQPKGANEPTKDAKTTESTDEKSNASGEQIGSQPCLSSNSSACKSACEKMGGTFNESGDRKCYKNGMAISGGMFGGAKQVQGKNA